MGWPNNGPPLSRLTSLLSMRFSHVTVSAIMLLSHGGKGSYGRVGANNDAEI